MALAVKRVRWRSELKTCILEETSGEVARALARAFAWRTPWLVRAESVVPALHGG